MSVVNGSFDHPLKLEEGASAQLAGGIMGNGYQCGMLWGAALAAGAEAYKQFGLGRQSETIAIVTAHKLVESFVARNKNANCSDLTELNMKMLNSKDVSNRSLILMGLKFIFKGGPIMCFSMSANYAQVASNEIRNHLNGNQFEVSDMPLSCAAMVARKMGATDMHATMVSGFAGGIGLSGGGCGVLGAAIWITGMRFMREKGAKIGYQNPIGSALIERFLENSDYEFECEKIVGRKFTGVADHANFIQNGGCAKIIDALAAASTELSSS